MNLSVREIISSIVIFVYFFLLLRVDGLGSAPGDTVVIGSSGRMIAQRAQGGGPPSHSQIHHQNNPPVSHQQHMHQQQHLHQQHLQHHLHNDRNSYSLLSEAMKQAVNHEFSKYLLKFLWGHVCCCVWFLFLCRHWLYNAASVLEKSNQTLYL